jgi:hypothetical protein
MDHPATGVDASIYLRDSDAEVRFHWRGFDGDDCFDEFHIDLVKNGATKCFQCGPCAVWGLRRLVRFFRDGREASVVGGFQNPDKCFYDVVRTPAGFRVSVTFERSELSENIELSHPEVRVDDDILRTMFDE